MTRRVAASVLLGEKACQLRAKGREAKAEVTIRVFSSLDATAETMSKRGSVKKSSNSGCQSPPESQPLAGLACTSTGYSSGTDHDRHVAGAAVTSQRSARSASQPL